MRRSGSTVAFAVTTTLACFVATALACATQSKRDPDPETLDTGLVVGDGSTDVGPPPPIDGLVSVVIDPASAALTLAWASPLVSAKQAFKATGTFKDGSTKDVTAAMTWSTSSSSSAISVSKGNLDAAAPGKFDVIAQAGTVVGKAAVTVKLTGNVVAPGFPADMVAKLDGAAGTGVNIAYPLDGALVPARLGPMEFQIQKSDGAQSLARVAVTGEVIDLKVYTACTAIPTGSGGCAAVLDDTLAPVLGSASEADTFSTRVRLATPTGGALAESAPVDVRWATSSLSGGLYYWRAYDHDKSSGVARFDLDKPGKPPEKFFQSNPDSPPLPSGEVHPCVGCHAISADGKKMGLTFGGSDPSSFALMDIAKKEFIAKKNTLSSGYATVTTFSPDGARLVNGFRGQLLLRQADATLADIGGPLFPTVGEMLAAPYWSGDGKSFVFVSWQPGAHGASGSKNGDLVRGGQIWLAESDGAAFPSAPKLLVPRVPNRTQTYPATSDDSKFVVFNEARCDGPPTPGPYGNDPCDGYDDPSAKLKLVAATGGAPIELARANGLSTWANSWPRFSPSHGKYRGKNLYWIAFSSRRPYGLRLAGSTDGSTKPQLWFAAVLVDDSGALGVDPSFAPVWLPNQNDADGISGNHVPQWVTVAVPVIK